MQEKELQNWQEFEQRLQELRAQYGNSSASPLLFRGQANSNWPLETTLERKRQTFMSFNDFYTLIMRVVPAIEAFTDASIPAYDPELRKTFKDPDLFSGGAGFPSDLLSSYMVYLRHHGFPSPLLDWSYSPYVAAFFAFRDDDPKDGKKRSIFAYCERPYRTKGGMRGEPRIRVLGPDIRSHPRHFRQQSSYTFCSSFDDPKRRWQFDSHQHLFEDSRQGQDFLWKFSLPSTEKIKVLQLLDEYNLNVFSLFASQEALLETMWFRKQIFRQTSGLPLNRKEIEVAEQRLQSVRRRLSEEGTDKRHSGK